MTQALKLIIGTRRFSSWSLRPWLMLKATGLAFDVTEIALRQPDTKEQILRHSPSGKVPLLMDGSVKIWDSLAIGEYLAEKSPQTQLWPDEIPDRAWARSIAAEMHSGFQALRSQCSMDVLLDQPLGDIPDDLQTDISRITAIWDQCRSVHGPSGPFLFGHFTIADAMFAPVVSRFATYHLPTSAQGSDYITAIMGLDWMREWIEQAQR